MRTLRMGTRGSLLAVTQAGHVKTELEKKSPDLTIKVVEIKTQGDRFQKDEPFSALGTKGIFVRELDEALLEGRIDFAVHSMKDLPSELEEGIVLASVPKAEDSRDALISDRVGSLEEITPDMVAGTASVRRQALLKSICPGIQTRIIRGNLDTRLRKLQEGDYDLILVAAAGMHRLGRENAITSYLSPKSFIPAPCQGILAVTSKENDQETLEVIQAVNDSGSWKLAKASREFLRIIQGGCQVPLGLHIERGDSGFSGFAFVGSPDGSRGVRVEAKFETLGIQTGSDIAHRLLESGGKELMREFGYLEG